MSERRGSSVTMATRSVDAHEISRSTVQTELGCRGVVLRFRPALEAAFERETQVDRVRHLVRAAILALVLSNCFLVSDLAMIPDAFGACVLLHAVCTLAYSAVICATPRITRPATREAVHALSSIVAILGSVGLCWLSHAPGRGCLAVAWLQYIVYANVVLRLRQVWALAFSVIGGLAAGTAVLAGSGLGPDVRMLMLISLVSTAGFTLYANAAIEAGERRRFLLTLDQRLCAEELSRMNDRLSAISTTDWLTGVANRRGLERYLAESWAAAALRRQTLALLMVDVDHFKLFNDQYGHPAGDACLTRLALLIGQQLRGQTDRLARYGGEEFAVLLPGADQQEATRVAERIRQMVERLGLPHGAPGASVFVTVSIGAGSAEPAYDGGPEQLIAAADRALYMSKQLGRNRVHPEHISAERAMPESEVAGDD